MAYETSGPQNEAQMAGTELEDESTEEQEIPPEMVEFFESLEPQGELFVGDWGYDVEVDPTADTFYFTHKDKTVHIAPNLVERVEMDRGEQKFVFEHELGHLAQLLEDPDAYVGTFDTAEEKAEELAEDYPSQKSFAKKAWGNFFNAFLDVDDNARVQDRDPDYRRGGEEEDTPKGLYKKVFPEDKMGEGPLSMQYINAALRRNMTNESMEDELDEEVRTKLNETVSSFGRKFDSIHEFVDGIIANPKTNLGTVIQYMEDFLYEPFEELLRKDIEEGNTDIEKSPGDVMDGESGPFSKEVAKRIAEKHKEAQKSPQEKGGEEAEEDFKDKMKEAGLSEQEAERMAEIRERTRDQVEQLSKLWERFIQINSELEQHRESGFKTGSSVSATKVAEQLPVLLSQPSEAEIFNREIVSKESESVKPKEISLDLVVDLSGSMSGNKEDSVQEVAYALSKSLINFYRNSRVDFELEGKDNPISISLNIIGFSNEKISLLDQSSNLEEGQDQRERMPDDLDEKLANAIIAIKRENGGGTQDASALEAVKEKILDQELQEKRKEDENISVVLEITDGETDTADRSKQIIKEINEEKNVYPRAIQIPGPIYSEEGPEEELEPKGPKTSRKKVKPPSGKFREVWQDKGKKLEDLSTLKETVVRILYEAIEGAEE